MDPHLGAAVRGGVPRRDDPRLADLVGKRPVILLALALVLVGCLIDSVATTLLLGFSEGPAWGWGSAAVLGLLIGGVAPGVCTDNGTTGLEGRSKRFERQCNFAMSTMIKIAATAYQKAIPV